MAALAKKSDMRMTEGSIFRQLLLFSLPLLAGNFFQQCYNAVDSIVVGRFVGKAALAAVGSVNPIINTLIGLFLGLSAGVGVVISQLYGAQEEKRVGQAVQTSLLLVFLSRGASEISTKFGLNDSFGDILTGIILFCIIGSEFFITYKLSLNKSAKKEG